MNRGPALSGIGRRERPRRAVRGAPGTWAAVASLVIVAASCGDDDADARDAGVLADIGSLDDAAPFDTDAAGLDAARTDGGRRGPRLNHDADCDGAALDAGPAVDGGPSAALLASGPYSVGVRTITMLDASRGRTLPVEVWYPIERASTSGTANAYFLDTSLGTLAHLCSAARRDAVPSAPDPSSDGWPLVVFSHGFGGIRFQSFFLTEHLASHGHVVVAPDHVGNTLADLGALGDDAAAAQSAVDRPLDVRFVLDRMLEPDAAGTGIAIDPARVAVSGHSFGAWTSFESARLDRRLRVVVPLAPGFRDPSSPAIAAELLSQPLLVFGASEDRTTPFDEGALAAYEVAPAPKQLVRIEGAGHLDFSDLCQVEAARAFIDDGCDPAVLDPAIVRDRVKVLVLAFLRRHLAGDVSADAALACDAVVALGNVECWREP